MRLSDSSEMLSYFISEQDNYPRALNTNKILRLYSLKKNKNYNLWVAGPEIFDRSRQCKKKMYVGDFGRYTQSNFLLLPTVLVALEQWIPNLGYTLESPRELLKILMPRIMIKSMISESLCWGVGKEDPDISFFFFFTLQAILLCFKVEDHLREREDHGQNINVFLLLSVEKILMSILPFARSLSSGTICSNLYK